MFPLKNLARKGLSYRYWNDCQMSGNFIYMMMKSCESPFSITRSLSGEAAFLFKHFGYLWCECEQNVGQNCTGW